MEKAEQALQSLPRVRNLLYRAREVMGRSFFEHDIPFGQYDTSISFQEETSQLYVKLSCGTRQILQLSLTESAEPVLNLQTRKPKLESVGFEIAFLAEPDYNGSVPVINETEHRSGAVLVKKEPSSKLVGLEGKDLPCKPLGDLGIETIAHVLTNLELIADQTLPYIKTQRVNWERQNPR